MIDNRNIHFIVPSYKNAFSGCFYFVTKTNLKKIILLCRPKHHLVKTNLKIKKPAAVLKIKATSEDDK